MIKDINIKKLKHSDFKKLLVCQNDKYLINLEYIKDYYEIYNYHNNETIKFLNLNSLKKYLIDNKYKNLASI